MRNLQLGTLAVLLFLLFAGPSVSAEDFHFQHEHVLGTSLQLAFTSDNREQAGAIEQRVLEEIDRLDAILSRYSPDSELMRWQRGETSTLSADLTHVLKQAEQWRHDTKQAFDVRAGAIAQLWQASAERGELPSDGARQRLIEQLREAPYTFVENDSVKRNDNLALSLDGLAKGYVLDCVCEMIERDFPGTTDFVINIGGDIRKLGDAPLEVSIENPATATEGAAPLETFVVARPMAMATSGDYRRTMTIGDREVSHIFDPRSGLPAHQLPSATVVSTAAIDADALATAVSVLGANEGLALVESLPQTEACVVTADGLVLTSSGWPLGTDRLDSQKLVVMNDAVPAETGLFVDFTIDRPKGGRYRRPYVAMWLEDADGFPVKTEILWLQTEQPGPRWHRDLTRWYRNDRLRKTVEKSDLIKTISGATRGPGEYQAHFDGTDNLGKPLSAGQYTLCLEVAREHGTYQIIREPITWGDQAVAEKKLKGNVEVGAMSYRFIPTTGDKNEAS